MARLLQLAVVGNFDEIGYSNTLMLRDLVPAQLLMGKKAPLTAAIR